MGWLLPMFTSVFKCLRRCWSINGGLKQVKSQTVLRFFVYQQNQISYRGTQTKYQRNQKSRVKSKTNVGNSSLSLYHLGSTLVALAIHPILLEIASDFQVIVAAYADNVVFTGLLSVVIRAQDWYRTLMAEVGLQLNPAESQLHVPEWRSMSSFALSQILTETPFHIT